MRANASSDVSSDIDLEEPLQSTCNEAVLASVE